MVVAAVAALALASAAPAAASYGWPVKPFHQQHAVRGYLGDPRIGRDGARISRSLHFGIDVCAPNGTPVYAVVSGRVRRHPLHADVVIVDAGGTRFEYWHVVPAATSGYARAHETVIGRVEKPWAHVHLAEARGSTYLNPLRPGALAPYRDATRPAIRAILRSGGRLVVDAIDTTPLPVPPPWQGLPVAPALVEWRVEMGGWHRAVDVRIALPRVDFAAVYAPSTRQNHASTVGRYLFELRGAPTDAVVAVRVADTAGNAAAAVYAPRVPPARR